jgi:hypothetical protein
MHTRSTLLQELVASARLARRAELAGTLAVCGLAGRALPLWGFAAVEAGPHHYEPHPAGKVALITGAFEDGLLVDLVATSLATRAMRRRRGEAALQGEPLAARLKAALERPREAPPIFVPLPPPSAQGARR